MTRIFAILTALVVATATFAQTYPERVAAGLNDFADIVPADVETRIMEKLAGIEDDHGVEVAIVTLSSVRFYAQDSTIEDYAEGLFNTWGIGSVEDNNGLLLLVFRDDRELRIQIGEGYDDTAQAAIDAVINDDILPAFRDGDFASGIESGVDGLLTRLIDPPASSAPSDTGEGSGNTLYYIIGGVIAAIAGVIGLNKRAAAKLAAQPCSFCGKTGLQRSTVTLEDPTTTTTGNGETRLTCPSCGHVDATPYTISMLKADAPKGGGKTKGDGATGKW